MKKLLFLALLISSSFTISAQHLDFGAGVQLLDGFDAIGVQGKALYAHDEKIDVAGTFTFYFEEGLDFAIDVDGHYKLLNVSDKFNFYPLAGVNILKYTGDTNFGINLGGMFDFVFESYRCYVEPKIILTDGSPFVVSGGILF